MSLRTFLFSYGINKNSTKADFGCAKLRPVSTLFYTFSFCLYLVHNPLYEESVRKLEEEQSHERLYCLLDSYCFEPHAEPLVNLPSNLPTLINHLIVQFLVPMKLRPYALHYMHYTVIQNIQSCIGTRT